MKNHEINLLFGGFLALLLWLGFLISADMRAVSACIHDTGKPLECKAAL